MKEQDFLGFDIDQVNNIVRKVVMELETKAGQSLLVLIPDYITEPEVVIALKKENGGKLKALTQGKGYEKEYGIEALDVNEKSVRQRAMADMCDCKRVAVITPSVDFLKRAATANEKCFFCDFCVFKKAVQKPGPSKMKTDDSVYSGSRSVV